MIEELIRRCHSEETADLLLEVFQNSATFVQSVSIEEKVDYFKQNFTKIIYDFIRFVKFIMYRSEQSIGYKILLQDSTPFQIVFVFQRFVSFSSREKFQQAIRTSKHTQGDQMIRKMNTGLNQNSQDVMIQ